MSIKMKLSAIISLIVISLYIFYQIVSEYTLVQGIRTHMELFMQENSSHAAHIFANNSEWRQDDKELNGNLEIIQIYHTYIKEVTLFHTNDEIDPLGTYMYQDANSDYSFVQEAKKEGFTYRRLNAEDRIYYRSYIWTEELGDHVVSIVYDNGWFTDITVERRKEMLLYSSVMIMLVLSVSYMLICRMLSPLKDILWKVNEVSSARFHQSIRVKRKDEFGQLAIRINAMSQNLSIYMDKLRKAFEDNRRMKEHLESFINNSSDAIYLVDLQGNVIQVNSAFLKLFDYELDDVLDKPINIIPESHMDEILQYYHQLLSDKLPPPFETYRMTRTGVMIPVSISMCPLRNKNGVIFAIFSSTRDMRSRNRMEELLRRSEKLTTVGQLAAGVAHEIRNPLTSLRGFLQLQKQTRKLNQEHVDLMLSELDRINFIVGEFLILAKPQAVKYVEKDVRNVIGDVLTLLDSEAHLHNIEFKMMFTEKICLMACEENQLKQVFINLLKNAIEAMPNGGSIHIHIKDQADQIIITITDEGIGIPEEIMNNIGDPFFTAKETGTGLGIMVSQRIIHSHRGIMDIHSQVNVGTTITVTLPALKEGA